MVTLLPIPINNRNIPLNWHTEQRDTSRDMLNKLLGRVLQLRTFKQNSSAKSVDFNICCVHGNFGHCQSVSAAQVADCPEYSDLHHHERHVCLWSECPTIQLGDYVRPDNQHSQRNNNLLRMHSDANTKAADPQLSSRHGHREYNVFRHIPFIVIDIPTPDLHHTIQIGMVDHLQKCIFHFMKTYEQLGKYNATLLCVSAYHDLTPKTKSYEDVSQWNGNEMEEMSRYLPGVVTQSLPGGNLTQHPIFNQAKELTQVLQDFNMYALYQSHDDPTLSYMGDVLCRVHTFKDVFLLG
jgi:hypothetical protein